MSINLADYKNIENNRVEKCCDNVKNDSVKNDSVLYNELEVDKFYVIKLHDKGVDSVKCEGVDSDEKNVYCSPHMGKLVGKIPSTPYFDIYTTGIKSKPGYIHPGNQYRVEKGQAYNPSLYCFYKLDHKYTISENVVTHGIYGEKFIQFNIEEKSEKASGKTVSSDGKAGGKKRKTKKGKRGKKSKDSRKKSKSKRKNRK